MATKERISPLKCIHLHFFCGVITDAVVPNIWGEVAASPAKQEGLYVLSQYLLTGMESCRRDFHGHAQLHHVGGGSV